MSASQTADMSLLFASQWHLTHIQLVNWGTFCGYKDLRLLDADGQPAQVAMITGESGTGKSTLFDAKTAVLMRSTARFNAASNQTTGRARSARERNLYSYVMGKQDDEYDPATGEARESYLRDPNTANWGAVVLTFACTTGETFCAARFYYVSAHATGVPDTWYLTADEELDPRNMSAHAASKFGRTSLRAAYPAAKIHEGQEAFLRTVWRQLGIGKDGEGDSATRLQERIQAGTTITDVDALFKSLVIDEPSTYEKADEACMSFREHEATWDEMDRARRKTADLADIRGLHKDREAYLAEKALIDSCRPGEDEGPVALWTCRRRMEVLDTHARACDERVDELDAQIAQREEEIERAKAVLAELEEEVRNRGGGAIDRLERDAQAARNRLGDARDLRRRLEGYLTDIGRALPQDEETFDALMQESEGFLASYDELHGKLEDELLASAVHEQQLAAQERDLASHLQFYEQHPVNITKRMISDRQRISRATGIPEEELPYAAELMDIAEGQEEWRDAANVGFHGLATLMLVDRARLDEFSVRLNRVQLDHRVSFQGVRPRAFKAPRSDANRLSSKIVFARESPFAAWVAEWVHDTNHDYICVDRPEELGGRGQRITREGQTRQRSRGAHGFNRHDTLIIGFTNKARVQEIRSELAGVRAELSKVRAKLDESKRELAALGKRRDAALQLQPLRWEALDEFALQAKLDDLLAQIEQLRQDQTLAQLLEQRKQQDALVSRLTEEQGASRREREQEDLQAKAAHGASQEASERAHTLEAAGSTVSAEQEELIASYAQRAEQPYLGTDDAMGYLARNYDATVASLTRSMRNRARSLDNDARERTEALEKTFASYRDHWLDYDDPLGTTVESYPDYLRILEELEAEQLDLHIDDWLIDTLRRAGAGLSPLSRAYTTDLREIRRRMRPINDIMSNFKFGPDEGELEIVVTERSPKAIRGFREELAQWARLATQAEFDDPDRLHHQLRAFMAKLEEALVQKARGPLNTKNLVYITVVAHYPKREDLPDKAYSSLGAKSGGETQELIAFILGAALLFCLGDNSQALPSFAPVFLDEAFIKADERFTQRAIKALAGLGFQVIIAVPTSKVQAVEPVASEFVCITKDPVSNHSFIEEMTGVRLDA